MVVTAIEKHEWLCPDSFNLEQTWITSPQQRIYPKAPRSTPSSKSGRKRPLRFRTQPRSLVNNVVDVKPLLTNQEAYCRVSFEDKSEKQHLQNKIISGQQERNMEKEELKTHFIESYMHKRSIRKRKTYATLNKGISRNNSMDLNSLESALNKRRSSQPQLKLKMKKDPLQTTEKCFPTSQVSKIHGFLSDQNIKNLVETTHYSERELFALFNRFKALCGLSSTPYGIDKDTFRKGVPLLSVEDDLFVDRVFEVLDEDGSGIIEWEEFIEAMSALEKGTREIRTAFLFRVYDIDKDGGISKEELYDFFISSLMVTVDDNIREVSEYFVNQVFTEIDSDTNGKLTVDEAYAYIDAHPEVKDIYGMFGRSMTSEQMNADSKSSGSKKNLKSIREIEKQIFHSSSLGGGPTEILLQLPSKLHQQLFNSCSGSKRQKDSSLHSLPIEDRAAAALQTKQKLLKLGIPHFPGNGNSVESQSPELEAYPRNKLIDRNQP